MEYLPVRNNVNSLFGAYSIPQNSTNITFADNAITNDSITDYIMRGKDGIQKKIMRSDKTITAISDPQSFITEKTKDLKTIIAKIETVFKDTYTSELKRGLSHEITKKNTVIEVDRQLDKLLRNHSEDYPEELAKRAIKKLTG